MKCPKCKAKVEFIAGESEFCVQCGADLTAVDQAAAGQKESDSAEVAEKIPANVDFSKVLKSIYAPGQEASPQIHVVTPVVQVAPASVQPVIIRHESAVPVVEDELGSADCVADIPAGNSGDCCCLEVAYNRQIFFLSGSTTVIKLRLTPQISELKSVLLFMETQINGKAVRRQIPVTVRDFARFRSFPVQLPFSADDISGSISLSFYIGCNTGKNMNYYEFHVEHPVYNPSLSSAQIASQVNMEIHAAGAADVNIKDALSNICKNDPTPHELIQKLNQLTPNFVRQELFASNWRPDKISNSYSTEKLMLVWKDMRILLNSKKNVFFGRDMLKSDFVVKGSDPGENATVSRVHGEIAYAGDVVRFINHSSMGSWINDRKVDDGGVQLPDSSRVEFGDITWSMIIQRCQRRGSENICQSCVGNKIKSVIVKRHDDKKECYLLVWQCCELGRFIPDLEGWEIFARDGAFFIRTPEGNLSNLRPGMPVSCGGTNIEVRYFPQWK